LPIFTAREVRAVERSIDTPKLQIAIEMATGEGGRFISDAEAEQSKPSLVIASHG